MSTTTGFSDVDGSGRSGDLVDYLALMADRLADYRQEGLGLLNPVSGSAVLDVGCGAGEICVELADRVGPAGRIAGVDVSEAMIEAARRAAAAAGRDIDLRVASAYQLPFTDQSFDVVRAERVFQHLADPDAALTEMLRVTRIGGQIMLVDPDHGQASVAVDDPGERKVFEAARRSLLGMIVNPHSGIRLRPMLQRAGLGEIRHLTRILDIAYADFARACFLHDLLAAAMAASEISQVNAEQFVAALENRHRTGTFLANAVGYTVVGTRMR